MCTDNYREVGLRSSRPWKAAKILPSPSHKPDALCACSCLTYLQSSLPCPWGPHLHLTQPVLDPTSLFEEKHFFLPWYLSCFTILMLPLQHPLLNFLTLSPGPLRPSPPVPHFILFQSIFSSSSSCSSALVCFALRSQVPNLMHSCAFRKFQPCVSEKHSGWMLYFSCKATASLHTNTCVNGNVNSHNVKKCCWL